MPRAAKAVSAGKATPAKKAATSKSTAKKAAAPSSKKAAAPAEKAAKAAAPAKAAPRSAGRTKKPVLDKFLLEQQALLHEERDTYEQQAAEMLAEANQLAAEAEPGDVQFDEESGEGGTTNIDRERDLALVAQARIAIEEIDFALAKIDNGTYGSCETCSQPIVKARLKAIPHARQCIQCKSGGLSRR